MGPRSSRTSVLATATAVALAATLGGCSSSVQVTPAPGTEPVPCGEITLASNPWVGYTANLAVISYIAETELNCDVVVKEEGEEDSWKHLAAGEVDAILENWGHDDLKKQYIDREKVAVEAGLTGNTGVLGWYVPPWMAEEYPDITDWRSLKKYDDLFRTPESGSKGQLLGGDPTYVTNDEDLIRNLELNFTVIYSGSEDALIEALQEAEEKKTPLLVYFWEPQWLLADIPLVHIKLPEYTPGCDADPETITCDYQPYDLDKIENKEFAYSGNPAAELIQNFTWTNDDQNQVARDITVNEMTMEQAAKKWMDAHPDVWRAWLPTTSTS